MQLSWDRSPRHRGDTRPNWWLSERNSTGYFRNIASVCPSDLGRWWVMRIADTAQTKNFTDPEEAKAYAVAILRMS